VTDLEAVSAETHMPNAFDLSRRNTADDGKYVQGMHPGIRERWRKGFVQLMKFQSIEALEARCLFSLSPDGTDQWATYATLTHQDEAVSQFPLIDGTTVRVAVIDRGIDYTAPELGGSVAISKTVWGGENERDSSGVLLDDYGHGTTVASLIAASGYTLDGTYNQGLAPNSQIIDLKEESSADIKSALDYVIANATRLNIQVVDMTDFENDVQAGANDPTVYTSELQTLHTMGVYIVTPVGNTPGAPITDPALDPNVVGVGGIDQNNNIWGDTQRGAGLDLHAPGVNVTAPFYTQSSSAGFDQFDDNYDGTTSIVNSISGTSWSAAYVAGEAALIKQMDRTLTPDQVTQILQESGDPTPDSAPVDGITSYQRLNVLNAINETYQVADDRNHTNYSIKRAAPVAFKRGDAVLTGAKLIIGKSDVWSVTIPDTRTIVIKTDYAGPTKLPLVNLINTKGNSVGAVTSRGLRITVGPGTYYLYFQPTQSLVGTYGFDLTTVAVGAALAKAIPAVVSARASTVTSVDKDQDDVVLDKSDAGVFAK
jgi:hypothetical protein